MAIVLWAGVDIIKSAINASRIVIAQINPAMPRTHGDGFIHIRQIDFLVEVNQALPSPAIQRKWHRWIFRIARHCASVIVMVRHWQNGHWLRYRMRCFMNWRNHKDLWNSTRDVFRWRDWFAWIPSINNRFKKKHRQKVVSTLQLAAGDCMIILTTTQCLHFWIGLRQCCLCHFKNPKCVPSIVPYRDWSYRSVCADSIGFIQYSGRRQGRWIYSRRNFRRWKPIANGPAPITMEKVKITPFLQWVGGHNTCNTCIMSSRNTV